MHSSKSVIYVEQSVPKHDEYRRPNNIKNQVCKIITDINTSMHILSRMPTKNTLSAK